MKRLMLCAGLGIMILASSCVSKKKYTAMEGKYEDSQSQLYKTNQKKQEYKDKLDKIQSRVDQYYAKINDLQEENENKLEQTGDGAIISERAKKAMRETLKNVDPSKLAEAESLNDSIDLAISYNLRQALGDDENDDDLNITVDRTVVEITISDKLLFRSGSYSVNPKSYKLLKKISEVVKSEPAMEVLVEGHTDSRTLVDESYIIDNWDLSVRRSTSVVRILQDKYGVDGEQLISSGRSSYKPIAENDTKQGRQKNRRTRIIILPNLDKFLAMLEEA